MKNIEIRERIRENRLRHYEVATALGISEYTLSIWLRRELSDEKKQEILAVVDRLIGEVRQ